MKPFTRTLLLTLVFAGALLVSSCRTPHVNDLRNRPPSASLSVSPEGGVVPLAVVFTLESGDPDGDRIECSVSFGDGTRHAGCLATLKHTYEEAGDYIATLTVTDNAGETAEDDVEITVRNDQSQPVVTVYVAGDIATCNADNDEETASLISDLSKDERGWKVLALGDLAYPDGRYQDFQNCYAPSWGKFKTVTYPIVGNHEYHDDGAGGYFRYWGERASGPDGWYTFTLGPWRVYALNTNCSKIGGCGADSDEYSWLQEQLEANDDDCTMVIGHHPRYSSGRHGDNESMDDIWGLLVKYDVEVYLAGHDHDYERFAAVDADGVRSRYGTAQFVIGTGGIALYDMKARHDTSEYSLEGVYGVLEMELEADKYTWRFVDTEGHVRDSGSDTCH